MSLLSAEEYHSLHILKPASAPSRIASNIRRGSIQSPASKVSRTLPSSDKAKVLFGTAPVANTILSASRKTSQPSLLMNLIPFGVIFREQIADRNWFHEFRRLISLDPLISLAPGDARHFQCHLFLVQKSSLQRKTSILDEFCATCGYDRKHAIRLLRGFSRFIKPKVKKRGGKASC